MRNAGLEETQAGIKIAERNINNLRYADDTTLMAESEEELKRLFGSSFLSTIRVVLSEYLKLLIFLLAIFDFSLCFIQPSISYDAYKQGDNIQL